MVDNSRVDPAEIQRMEEMKKTLLMSILTKDAKERLSRLKLVKPDIALQLEMYLVQLYQNGKIRGRLDDNSLKDILEMLMSGKRFNIIKK